MSSSVLALNDFQTTTALIIQQFTTTASTSYQRIFELSTELFHSSLVPTAFNTDWSLEYGNISNDFLLRSVPRTFTNSSCNCVVSDQCQQSLRVGPPGLILPGLVIGCSPIAGLRLSTLECFFSSDCIAAILTFTEYYTEPDGSPPANFTPPTALPLVTTPLNSSISSRFSKATPIDALIGAMFIERWTSTSSFEKYFAACAPTSCRYEYVQRNDLLYVVTTLLGLYGGLTVGLRFLIWNAPKLYRFVRRRFCTRRTAVEPWS